MSSDGSIVLIGLPASGKSTFLAALWHQLESSEIPTSFTTARLQEDREYLNRIRDTWLVFDEIPRTSLSTSRTLLLHLRHVRTRKEINLLIPDVAGETFALQWAHRQASAEYVVQLQSALGILLFVHCQQVRKAELLSTGPSLPTGLPLVWEPHAAPTQVKLVDLLQFALQKTQHGTPTRVAIIISAWDEVSETTTPETWLARNMPLLDQFRIANQAVMKSKVFGVSAIGGRLSDGDTLSLLDMPSTRARIQLGEQLASDLTMPFEFLTIDDQP